MSNRHPAIETAARNYHAAIAASKRLGIDYEIELGEIWRVNVERFLRPIIESAVSIEGIFEELNKRAFFDYTAPQKYIRPSLNWYREHACAGLQEASVGSRFCESALLPKDRVELVDGRLISTDFLNKSAIACHLVGAGMIGERGTVIEIGAGYGALARLIKLLRPSIRYIIFDLPESLFCSEVFLRQSFPDATFAYCAAPDEFGDLSADFVFIPSQYRDLMSEQMGATQVDLLVNTNSFGEMPLAISRAWIAWAEAAQGIQRIYSLNRFLNAVDKKYLRVRRHAMGFNLSWGRHWKVEEWEVNPTYERCPYFTSIFTRNLHLIVSRAEPSTSCDAALEQMKLQDWWLRPHGIDYTFREGGSQFPLHSKMAPELTADLGQRGQLFTLWENHRARGDAESARLLDAYLQYLSGPAFLFEECAFLRLSLASKPPVALGELWDFVNPIAAAQRRPKSPVKQAFRSIKRHLEGR